MFDGQGQVGNAEKTDMPIGGNYGSINTKDPWQHRKKGMLCRTCMWWVEKFNDSPVAYVNPLGRCRRHAPTISGFPAVFTNDWCGDHKLDENKI